jgi:uncharacterized membrane protein YgcG
MNRSHTLFGNRLAFAASLAFALSAFGQAALAAEKVGQTTLVVEKVIGKQVQEVRRLVTADPVHDAELLKSGAASAAAILLLDGTELALGADAEIVLDEFVYDQNTSAGKMILNVAVGTMRFATGIMPKPAYEIRTPSAVISVRGTIFTTHVTLAGTTFLAVEEGAIHVLGNDGREFDVPTGATLRLSPTGGAEQGRFRLRRGVNFAGLFDGGLATRQTRIMDQRLAEEAVSRPDQAGRTPRALILAFAENETVGGRLASDMQDRDRDGSDGSGDSRGGDSDGGSSDGGDSDGGDSDGGNF